MRKRHRPFWHRGNSYRRDVILESKSKESLELQGLRKGSIQWREGKRGRCHTEREGKTSKQKRKPKKRAFEAGDSLSFFNAPREIKRLRN